MQYKITDLKNVYDSYPLNDWHPTKWQLLKIDLSYKISTFFFDISYSIKQKLKNL